VCRYFLDLSEAETAQVLDWPLGSVKSRTARALNRLRGLLVPTQQNRVSSG
jgi:DNA-directed RNA polymerase specialized sigma24 family protein